MDWQHLWTQIGVIVGSLGSGSVALVAITKFAVRHWMDKSVEQYKQALKAEHDSAIENLRHELRLAAAEHDTRFKWLHERRVKAIESTHGALTALVEDVSSYVDWREFADEPSREEKRQIVVKSGKKCIVILSKTGLYFSDDLEKRMDALIRELAKTVRDFHDGLKAQNDGSGDNNGHWHLWEKVRDDARPILDDITSEFRVMLGVTKAEQSH